MESVLNYIVESSVGLGILVVFYHLIIKKSEVLWFNRLYLLLIIIFAVLLPLINFRLPLRNQTNLLPEIIVGGNYNLLDTIVVFGENTNRLAIASIEKLPWVKVFYIIGLSILIFRLLLGFFNLFIFKKRARVKRYHDFILIDTCTNHSPFSFFNMLFVNLENYDKDELHIITKHELAHIQLKHSFDILLVETILMIQWFNPFMWLLRSDLKEVHEFQADRRTLQSGINSGFYKELLLCEALNVRFVITNNLNKSLIKKRLKMMNNKINKTLGFIKPSIAIASLALVILTFACQKHDKKVYTEVDVMPEYQGGMEALQKHILESLKYPDKAMQQNIEGTVFVSFVIYNDGSVKDAKIVKSINPLLDNEALRVVNTLSKWTPGIKDGKNVNVQLTLPLSFKATEKPLTFVEEMPEFPEGEEGLRKYLMENVLYPKDAKINNKTGKSLVNFIINSTGKVESVKLAKSSGTESLDNEAVRVVKSMPDWNPGTQDGEAVNVEFTIPIQFMLENKEGAIVIHQSSVNSEQMIIDVDFIKESDNKLVAKGKAVDKAKKPLKGVNVIIGGTTTGTITKDDGTFKIEIGNTGEELVFSYVGKETTRIKIQR